ncbi:hypothetical protein UCRPC4_g00233 [Phaeomoniella chlamydospora]|uniref:Glycosyltransferase family 31 protein n=1 Tax=Phaeomoniella chlamydospora TaxID=158046 RepID=A0A0G2F460_PHACM|nr:hypothetical protein UCRPC4_g00233 [Phaeomoniella chlamydospora]
MITQALMVRLPVAFAFILGLLLLPYLYRRNYQPISAELADSLLDCDYERSAFPIPANRNVRRYSRGVIRPRFDAKPDDDLFEFERPFLESFGLPHGDAFTPESNNACKKSNVATVTLESDPPVELTAPILIGVATTVDRIENTFDSLLSQLQGTDASMIALVPEAPDLPSKQQSMRERGLDITLYPTNLPFLESYFTLTETFSYHIKNHRPHTKWIIWTDDDTYMPSLRSLGRRLKGLNHEQDHFYGAWSEKTHHLENLGRFPYGGGGIIVSLPVLEALHDNYEYCMGSDVVPTNGTIGGDCHVWACLEKVKPDLELTIWSELRQFDVHGSPAGIYEDGRPIYSFHHWTNDSWAPTPVVEMAAVKAVAGESSVRHRYVFDRKVEATNDSYDSSPEETQREFFVLTNGYSIVRYRIHPGVDDIDFAAREATWWEAVGMPEFDDYVQQLGPLRREVVPGIDKKRWYLQDAKLVDGNIHQLYIDMWRANEEIAKNRQRVEDWIEIIWLGR